MVLFQHYIESLAHCSLSSSLLCTRYTNTPLYTRAQAKCMNELVSSIYIVQWLRAFVLGRTVWLTAGPVLVVCASVLSCQVITRIAGPIVILSFYIVYALSNGFQLIVVLSNVLQFTSQIKMQLLIVQIVVQVVVVVQCRSGSRPKPGLTELLVYVSTSSSF